MYSSRTGQCRSYNMITSLATPFARSSCFEPAYITPMNDNNENTPITFYESHYNIKNNDSSCGYDTSYGNGLPNRLNPLKITPFDSRNSLWRRENSQIVGYAPRDYQASDGTTCPQQPYYVVDETGTRKVVCPILTSDHVQPQCKTCLTTVFQCEQYKEIDPMAYSKCREYQRMIHYDVVTPNGQLIPMAVEMDGEGFEVFRTAVQKCGFVCGSCRLNYPSMNFAPQHCTGPNYG